MNVPEAAASVNKPISNQPLLLTLVILNAALNAQKYGIGNTLITATKTPFAKRGFSRC